jgi:hypothetical protein
MEPTKLIIRIVKHGKFKGLIDIFYSKIESCSMFTCFDTCGHSDASREYYYGGTRPAKGEEITQGELLIKKVFSEGKYKIVKKMCFSR